MDCVPTNYVLSKNKKNVTFFHLKIQVFTPVKYCSILHGRVFIIGRILVLTEPVPDNCLFIFRLVISTGFGITITCLCNIL